jgi:hypothetical protein
MFRAKVLILIAFLMLTLNAETNNSIFTFVDYYNGSGGWRASNFTFKDPTGLSLGDGNIYVSDSLLKGVYVIDQDDKVVNAIGDYITYSTLARPMGIMYSKNSKTLYVTDTQKGGVLSQSGLSDLVRAGPSYSAGKEVVAVWNENNKLWVLNKERSVVEEYDLIIKRNTNEYLERGASSAKLNSPMDLYIDESHVYIADTGNNRVQVFDREFNFIRNVGLGKGGITLNGPKGVTTDGKRIYVSDTINQRVIAFSMDGYPLKIIGGGSADENYSFSSPTVLRYADNHLYVLDSKKKRVAKFFLDWSSYIPDITNEIESFESDLKEHKTKILDVLALMGVEKDNSKLDSKLQDAKDHADVGDYVKAQNSLDEAKKLLEKSITDDTASLRFNLKSRLDEYSSLFDYYKALNLLPEQSVELDKFIQLLADAKKSYDLDLYSDSVTYLLNIDSGFESFQSNAEQYLISKDNTVNTTPKKTSTKKAELIKEAAELEIELSDLSERATSLGLYSNTAPIHALASSAKSMIELGEYVQADSALLSARKQMDRLESLIYEKSSILSDANQSIQQAWDTLNSSPLANDKALIKKLVQAEQILRDNPQKAKELAVDVISSSEVEDLPDVGITTTLGALMIVSVGVIILAILTIALVKYRRSQKKSSGIQRKPIRSTRLKTRRIKISRKRGRR